MKIAIFIFTILPVFSISQEKISATIIDSITLHASNLLKISSTDTLYLKNNILTKKNNLGTFNYFNPELGVIKKVSSFTPLQYLVFYKGSNTIVLLDSQLNETHKIKGNQLSEVMLFEACGIASKNSLWIIDSLTQKIGLLNINNLAIKYLSTPQNLPITTYSSNYNNFYWVDNEKKFYNISINGTISKIDIDHLPEKIQTINSSIFFIKEKESIIYIDINRKKKHEFPINKKFTDFYFENGILSIFTNNKIINYKIILP